MGHMFRAAQVRAGIMAWGNHGGITGRSTSDMGFLSCGEERYTEGTERGHRDKFSSYLCVPLWSSVSSVFLPPESAKQHYRRVCSITCRPCLN